MQTTPTRRRGGTKDLVSLESLLLSSDFRMMILGVSFEETLFCSRSLCLVNMHAVKHLSSYGRWECLGLLFGLVDCLWNFNVEPASICFLFFWLLVVLVTGLSPSFVVPMDSSVSKRNWLVLS